jgi:serpin B
MTYPHGVLLTAILAVIAGANSISASEPSRQSEKVAAPIVANEEATPPALPPDVPAIPTSKQFEDRVFQKLEQKISWDFKDETIDQFARRIQLALDVPVIVDWRALDEVGVAPTDKLSANYQSISLHLAIDFALRLVEATWTLQGETLVITTKDGAEQYLLARVYPIDDLVAGGNFGNATTDELLDLVLRHLEVETWAENGGGEAEASVIVVDGKPLLIVTQTPFVHRKISQLLSDIRGARGTPVAASAPAMDVAEFRDSLRLLADLSPDDELNGDELPSTEALSNWGAAEIKSAAKRSNQFSFELFNLTMREHQGNGLLSGYGVREALVIATFAAEGETRRELQQALHLPDNLSDAALEALAMRSRIVKTDKSGEVIAASNSLWVQKQYPLKEAFAKLTDRTMGATARPIDFRNGPAAAAEINQWISENTKNRLRDVVGQDDFDSEARFAIVNALYFFGQWQTPFDAANTAPAAFLRDDGLTVEVPTMNGQIVARAGLDRETRTQIAEIPYRDQTTSMIILLPDRGDNALTKLIETVNNDQVDRWLEFLQVTHLDVRLPKFKFQQTKTLVPVLKKLGIHRAFELGQADFSGMSDELRALSDVLQAARIEVDEIGT